MKPALLVAGSVRAMGRNKLRTGFMMLGTLIGVAALSTVMALGEVTQDKVLSDISRVFSGSTIFLSGGSGMMSDDPRDGGPSSTLTLEDMAVMETQIPAVTAVDPMQAGGTRTVVHEGRASDIRILGQTDKAEVVWNRGVSRGSFLTADDVASTARVALIGEQVVTDLFPDGDPIGEQIRIGAVPFRVVGVLEPFGIDPHGLDRDNEIVVPVTTVMRRLRNVDYIASAKILVDPAADLDATVFAVEDLLRERHGLASDRANDFQMITPVQVEQAIEAGNRVFTVFLPIVAVISILVGGVVVANLMLMSVAERRGEIGLRKAVGARPRDIWWQFVLETVAITTTSGVLALGVAALALQVIARAWDRAVAYPWELSFLGLGVAVLVGLAAGVLPARRAAALDPIVSLR